MTRDSFIWGAAGGLSVVLALVYVRQVYHLYRIRKLRRDINRRLGRK